ncbi:hypothetical protein PFUGPA_05793 [Plasmodium falciparum Palo Alto/Uganda]|uniref:Uncharacterized protein n=6 Tax=Plasmodium falciparum TaxID=5833 RepID=W7K013_PLAFO|nr:hypothetical protein PFTANZ_00586 [Plasmodium falciparum Tanzania (2000708)]ETW51354.1 hypothetical protein PFMALIP_00513 [Plasmodium falciparum MaliPS096_E11]ETW52178.1 hypothetical protein PFUGPA_05793 [Plasmodium falciparum Palo Alto/Uganda]ETW63594.1 hypothetical protein PFMC_00522 [Plasmodium falciparum CAMP/Malaysia]EUR80391.1 hypothetical protein PFBG_00398 [Plasmodium falciparum 7G8]EWC90593.1 hypothetical protein PFNF54_00493 [Plasmodium falciparum NF54]
MQVLFFLYFKSFHIKNFKWSLPLEVLLENTMKTYNYLHLRQITHIQQKKSFIVITINYNNKVHIYYFL